jgi:hypothetical protein
MKIHYTLTRLVLEDNLLFVDRPYVEPESPVLLIDLIDDYIDNLADAVIHCIWSSRMRCSEIQNFTVVNKLMPEQRYVLICHADHVRLRLGYIRDMTYNMLFFGVKKEIYRLAKQEIEPGMFTDEDTL